MWKLLIFPVLFLAILLLYRRLTKRKLQPLTATPDLEPPSLFGTEERALLKKLLDPYDRDFNEELRTLRREVSGLDIPPEEKAARLAEIDALICDHNEAREKLNS